MLMMLTSLIKEDSSIHLDACCTYLDFLICIPQWPCNLQRWIWEADHVVDREAVRLFRISFSQRSSFPHDESTFQASTSLLGVTACPKLVHAIRVILIRTLFFRYEQNRQPPPSLWRNKTFCRPWSSLPSAVALTAENVDLEQLLWRNIHGKLNFSRAYGLARLFWEPCCDQYIIIILQVECRAINERCSRSYPDIHSGRDDENLINYGCAKGWSCEKDI